MSDRKLFYQSQPFRNLRPETERAILGKKGVFSMPAALLPYRPPYQWERVLRFLASRALPRIETVDNGVYARFVSLNGAQGRISVENAPEQNALRVSASASLTPALPDILNRLRVMFDLDNDPAAVYDRLKFLNEIKAGLCVAGTRSVGCFDAFETAVRTVLGQQITVKAAQTLAARFIDTLGTPLKTGTAFPLPEKIAELPEQILIGHGIMPTRAKAISAIAKGLSDKTIDLSPAADPATEIPKLLALPGVGPWTANYLAIRTMRVSDAFLFSDFGVKKSLAPMTVKEIKTLQEKCRPFGSYATFNLWNSL